MGNMSGSDGLAAVYRLKRGACGSAMQARFPVIISKLGGSAQLDVPTFLCPTCPTVT
jgi:hypothetical protein